MNPLTGIYGAATALRNALFDHRLLSAQRLRRPVVSVGNLSVGGSGKTPFVIALGGLLKARGVRFDVLSRGYRRKTRGVLVVEEDGSASDFGDEPLLIARRLGVPVIVGERRYQAGQLAEKNFESQLHILDDGFQHRFLARDFDIVLMTGAEFEDRLLPSGRLREPLSSLERADAIVLPWDFYGTAFNNTTKPGTSAPQGLKPAFSQAQIGTAEQLAEKVAEDAQSAPQALKRGPISNDLAARPRSCPSPTLAHSAFSANGECVPNPKPDHETRKIAAIDHLAQKGKLVWRMKREIVIAGAPEAPFVFCGIARPEQFFAQVRAAGISPAGVGVFRDHHAYNRDDIKQLLAARARACAGGFVTTEKDVVNLGPLQEELKPLAIATLRVVLENPADVVDTMLARIRK